MGIPLFTRALLNSLSQHRKKIEKESGSIGKVDILYLDANSIIHLPTSYERKTFIKESEYKDVIRLIRKVFEQHIRHFNPKKLLVLAVDGVTPMAKVAEQKKRRYKNAMNLEENDYDSSLITPGTEFMFSLDLELRKMVDALKDEIGIEHVIYSSHMTPGEGEHKIMQHAREYLGEYGTPKFAQVLYGNDSDLILLGLALDTKNLYVCKESFDPRDDKGRNMLKKRGSVLDIDQLHKALNTELTNRFIGEGDEPADYFDFIMLCSLLGNDFLPRHPLFCNVDQGVELIMKILSTTGKIGNKLDEVMEFLATLESFEESELSNFSLLGLYQNHLAKEKDSATKFLKYDSRIFRAMTKAKKVNGDVFRTLWYREEFGEFEEEQLEDVLGMCTSYIRGLFWTIQYYLLGQDSVTWLWHYPYYRAPLFRDMAAVYRAINNKKLRKYDDVIDVSPVENEIRHTPIHQLLMVMPPQSLRYVPKLLHVYYSKNSSIGYMMPGAGVAVNQDFCEVPFQEQIIVPHPVYHVIMTKLSALYLQKGEIKEYDPQKPYENHEKPKPSPYVGRGTYNNSKSADSGGTSSRGGRGRGTKFTSGRK